MTDLHLEVHIKSLRTLPTLHQSDEEGNLIYLGQCLPRSFQGNQAIPHASTCLHSPNIRKTFHVIYRAMDQSLEALLAQNNDQGHEQAIYCLSRKMIGAEHH